ncbi:chaperone binding protein, putative [Ricinus communis]|uniref:Chaperone binding protein, putative n=1 Tax=Ricinus communis TaxID=3988 RepID=B9RCI2_RICCO|nr:chaperone binding protein, putative [Ricinus communis]
MAQELAEKAKEAIFEDDFKLAIDLYSKAIDLDPTNPEFFADRAQANIKLNNFTEAVADANKAIELDPLKAKAYLRKGTACIKLEEYHTAKTALEKGLSVTIDVPGEDAYHFQPRLFGKIVPDKSQYQVLSTKIEIRLAKAEVINWTSLEYCKENIVPRKLNAPSVGSQRPLYPSSKTRAKDWDKLEAEVKKEEKDERLDGDAALNKMFRDIYQNADEDMRRAMMKSFVESSGTVLSTDWKEVGSKKVEGSAPEGMEMRKWEY